VAAKSPSDAPRPKRRVGRPPIGDTPNPVDAHVGQRLRARRTLLGWSQERLGDAVGLTFQQVQKYERGTNRISASRLWDMAQALDVDIAYFFEGLSLPQPGEPAPAGVAEAPTTFEHDLMDRRETLSLVRAYYSIKDEAVRRRLYDLTRSIARHDEAD
jgi:transcriptional regulator with XRE-family HTH domain